MVDEIETENRPHKTRLVLCGLPQVFRHLRTFVALGLALFATHASAEEFLELEDLNGRSIRASIVEIYNDNTITIRRDDGRLFEWLPIARFSESSRKKIAEWNQQQEKLENNRSINADSDLTVRFSRGRDDDPNDYGDPDDRVVKLEPSVSILNNEFNRDYHNVNGIAIIIGESVLTPGESKILFREKFTIDLPSRETVHWEGKPFTNRYDEYPGNGSGYGYKYEDYLIILFDSQGNPVIKTSSRKKYEENFSRVLEANPSKSYDEDFENIVPESRV